ncbi:MAG: hypothetical protein ACRD29_24305 [Acidimicrobiales bacterium]
MSAHLDFGHLGFWWAALDQLASRALGPDTDEFDRKIEPAKVTRAAIVDELRLALAEAGSPSHQT